MFTVKAGHRGPALIRALATLVAVSCVPQVCLADAMRQDEDDRRIPDGPNVLEAMRIDHGAWLVGTTLEATTGSTSRLQDEILFGASATRRFGRIGVGAKVAFDPIELLRVLAQEDEGRIEKHRFLFELHTRYAFELWGLDLLYGINVQGEARIEDHFGLIYVTPIELGVVLHQSGSNYLQLFVGTRVLAFGRLINHFLIDPNGYDSDGARDDLHEEEEQRAEGFIGLAFTRRVD